MKSKLQNTSTKIPNNRKSNQSSILNLSNIGKYLYYNVLQTIDLSEGQLLQYQNGVIKQKQNNKLSDNNNKQTLFLMRSQDGTTLFDHPAKHLWLQNSKNDNLIKDISMLKNQFAFPNLIQLVLNENNILSIQALHRVSFPSLKELDLNNNKIVQGRSLRKLMCPELQWLMISQNYIQDLSWMCQLWAPKLQALTLERLYDCIYGQDQSESIQRILKLQTKNLEFLYIAAARRKKWPQLDFMLLKKYTNIRISRFIKKQNFLVM